VARWHSCGLALSLVATATWGQSGQFEDPTRQSDNRIILGVGNQYLAAGADAIRAKQYDDGIRLTKLGLERATWRERSAGLSNLCAAHAAKGETKQAIEACTQSLEIDDSNWRAYNNRSYAYYLAGRYVEANTDLVKALDINPTARTMATIRGLLNERTLRPSVVVEEHQ
jgi:tetratricopeptide (TPR) repeat protein